MIPSDGTRLSIHRLNTPSRYQVATTWSGHVRRACGAPAASQASRSRSAAWDRWIQRAAPVSNSRTVDIAAVGPIRAGLPVSAADLVGCADISMLTNIVSSSRSRSGDVWASCSSSRRAGSILDVTVFAVSFFESIPADRSKDHPMAVGSRGQDTLTGIRTPLCERY